MSYTSQGRPRAASNLQAVRQRAVTNEEMSAAAALFVEGVSRETIKLDYPTDSEGITRLSNEIDHIPREVQHSIIGRDFGRETLAALDFGDLNGYSVGRETLEDLDRQAIQDMQLWCLACPP